MEVEIALIPVFLSLVIREKFGKLRDLILMEISGKSLENTVKKKRWEYIGGKIPHI